MLEEHIRKQIIQLIHQGVVPAIGYAGPMAVALCAARATRMLDCRPKRTTALLSVNILRNAMGMGIPGIGMVGLPITMALDNTVGKSEYQLEVIKGPTLQMLEDAKEYIEEGRVDIQLKQGTTKGLYIEVTCQASGQTAKAIIADTHTNFVYLCKNGEILLDKGLKKQDEPEESDIQFSFRMVYGFATTTPTNGIRFMLRTKEYNMSATNQSLKGNCGHYLGKTMDRPLNRGMFGNSIYPRIIAKTALAYDARMGGAMVPVISNSGPGNRGICATNPVMTHVMENENMEEELIRALTLNHPPAIYIKRGLDKLSALCGCVAADIDSSCGITYLMGGDYVHICYAIKNMITSLTGMICDGAKPSYSLEISSGVSTTVLSALLPTENRHVASAEGIIDEDVDRSMRNLTSTGKDATGMTSEMVLSIMISKQRC